MVPPPYGARLCNFLSLQTDGAIQMQFQCAIVGVVGRAHFKMHTTSPHGRTFQVLPPSSVEGIKLEPRASIAHRIRSESDIIPGV